MAQALQDILARKGIEDFADSTTLARGRAYFHNGAVSRLKFGPSDIRAQVQGSSAYAVRLAPKSDDSIVHECTCPVGATGHVCKHAVAVALAVMKAARGRMPASVAASSKPAAVGPDAIHGVALAMALLWTYRPRSSVVSLLSKLEWKRPGGRSYGQDDVKQAIAQLRARGSIDDMPRREGYVRLTDAARGALYRELLDAHPTASLRAALYALDGIRAEFIQYRWPVYDVASTIALVRLEFMSGAPAAELARLRDKVSLSCDWNTVLREGVLAAFDGALFERIEPHWRWELAYAAVSHVNATWQPGYLPLCEWAVGKLESMRAQVPEQVRLVLAEFLFHRGEHARMREALDGMDGGGADALRACLLVHQGAWAEAQAAFEAALKRRQGEVNARKRVLPASLAWLYPLALLAQQTPRHLELARKFCVGEAGQRKPSPYAGWGRFVHAIDARLGDAPLETQAFDLAANTYAGIEPLWTLMLAAWLGRDAVSKGGRNGAAVVRRFAGLLREACARCGFSAVVAQVDGAEAALRGDEPPASFFVSGAREQWRATLASLQALASAQPASDRDTGASRILWALTVGKRGTLDAVAPLEQKRGPRGWGKAKPLPLSRIASNERLSPADARVARAIRQDRRFVREFEIDLAAAIMALVGHPNVVLDGALDQRVDLIEGTPEVEVAKERDGYVVRVSPELRTTPEEENEGDDDDCEDLDGYGRSRREPAQSITLIQDSPARIRVIRFSAAQRRAAQLIGRRLAIPASAGDELSGALRALAGHFDVHADDVQAAREVDADPRVRAELWPTGEHLSLRLVAAPLGGEGPRLSPGAGRARVMAAIRGETVGARRDLAAERANLQSVLDALPDLDPAFGGGASEWSIGDPEVALSVVEALPAIAGLAAVEWPKGKPVRVHTIDTPQIAVSVTSERDWFHLQGRVAVDDKLVLDFERLLSIAAATSRFAPMGDGVYVALTRSLKDRLAEVAAVGETDKDGIHVPQLAAAWLAEVLEGTALEADKIFRDAIERLRRAQDETAPLPTTLQADLRPYQIDGYQWAMRLASAALGGCLADDMGLGKTLQGLAVLLARASGGPALVIAPTSVCGNWLAEARRFAPTLNVALYGEMERESVVANAGPSDVVIVSYAMLQQGSERFASRSWHTVIADEAQAIKNASTKRALAAFELDAGFRLALTGTPVENRLAELWSIMRFANPGLLGPISRFNERFAGPIERARDHGARHTLKRLVGPFILRRTKAQVLDDLPARTELVVTVAPDDAQAAHYEALRRQAIASADAALSSDSSGQARINILAQLMRLRRAACDPRLVSPDLAIVGAKVQAFANLAMELVANGHKALVFSQFVDFLTLLRQPLDAEGIAYQYLDGATPAAERTRRVAAFQAGEGELFLISLKAGGFGLNLTAADYVLITDPWWNPAAEDQAMGRAHRIGQRRPVTVYRLVAGNTVEERIVELHRSKRALADSILEGGEGGFVPSADDLIALMRG